MASTELPSPVVVSPELSSGCSAWSGPSADCSVSAELPSGRSSSAELPSGRSSSAELPSEASASPAVFTDSLADTAEFSGWSVFSDRSSAVAEAASSEILSSTSGDFDRRLSFSARNLSISSKKISSVFNFMNSSSDIPEKSISALSGGFSSGFRIISFILSVID